MLPRRAVHSAGDTPLPGSGAGTGVPQHPLPRTACGRPKAANIGIPAAVDPLDIVARRGGGLDVAGTGASDKQGQGHRRASLGVPPV